MSTFEDLSFSFEDFSGLVRLFPLPNLVLFPHVMQPLHIFEPRYRDLLEDAVKDDRLIAMVRLQPGWEWDYEGRPALGSTACLGRITTHCHLDDGTYNVLLLGLRRVRLVQELETSHRYRVAQAEVCDDYHPPGTAATRGGLQRALREAFMKVLPMLPEAREQLDQLLGSDVPLAVLTDVISYMLDLDLSEKETLLGETDVDRRAQRLLRHLSALAAGKAWQQEGQASFPPLFSPN